MIIARPLLFLASNGSIRLVSICLESLLIFCFMTDRVLEPRSSPDMESLGISMPAVIFLISAIACGDMEVIMTAMELKDCQLGSKMKSRERRKKMPMRVCGCALSWYDHPCINAQPTPCMASIEVCPPSRPIEAGEQSQMHGSRLKKHFHCKGIVAGRGLRTWGAPAARGAVRPTPMRQTCHGSHESHRSSFT